MSPLTVTVGPGTGTFTVLMTVLVTVLTLVLVTEGAGWACDVVDAVPHPVKAMATSAPAVYPSR